MIKNVSRGTHLAFNKILFLCSKSYFMKYRLLYFFVLLLPLLHVSCGINKQRIAINDFYIHANGMLVNKKEVHAYIFENNLSNLPFQDFIAAKYQTKNAINKSIAVENNGFKFILVLYDNDEFEKYFGTQNFEIYKQENAAEKTGNVNKFIAISVLSESGEDYLHPDSLIRKVAIDYLSNLKKNYLSNNGRL